MSGHFNRGQDSWEHGNSWKIIKLKIIHKDVPSWDDLPEIFVQSLGFNCGMITCTVWHPQLGWNVEMGTHLLHMLKGTPCPFSLYSPVLRDNFHLSFIENFPLAIFLAPILYLTRKITSLSATNLDDFQGLGNPLQYSCLQHSHGQRSLAGCSQWGHKELDTTDRLSTHSFSHYDTELQRHRLKLQEHLHQVENGKGPC